MGLYTSYNNYSKKDKQMYTALWIFSTRSIKVFKQAGVGHDNQIIYSKFLSLQATYIHKHR